MFHLYTYGMKDSLHVDLLATSMSQRSVKYRGFLLWNSLPEETKLTNSASLFDKLKTILL